MYRHWTCGVIRALTRRRDMHYHDHRDLDDVPKSWWQRDFGYELMHRLPKATTKERRDASLAMESR